jgi:hypothetical protein
MATRINNSPSVQIVERDLSLIAPQSVGTNIFIAGYAQSGPTDETLHITTKDELLSIYGPPTNSAERYFHHGIRELLNSPANIYSFRLPYGEGAGSGFGSEYSALVYPVNFVKADIGGTLSAVTTNLEQLSGTYVLGSPIHVTLTENEYNDAQAGSLFTWSPSAVSYTGLSATEQLGKAGVIILNKAQTTINSQFEGYYVGICDNTNINPASDFDAIGGAKTVGIRSKFTGVPVLNTTVNYTTIPNGTLDFSLSSRNLGGVQNSISQILEGLTDYNIDGRGDDDLLNIGVFKLRKSLYATEAYKIDYVLDGKITGSIDTYRKRINPTGGPQTSFFLESMDTGDRNVEILINPYMSNKFGSSAVDASGIPKKKIRVLTRTLSNQPSTVTGIAAGAYSTLLTNLGYADNLYPVGAYADAQVTSKVLGSIPSKLERALESVKNDEIYDIDVVVEAGLGTMHVMTNLLSSTGTGSLSTSYYDDTLYTTAMGATLDKLRTSGDLDAVGGDIRANYSVVFNAFENFCNLPSNTGGRGDCMFIADPIRQIMVTGKNTKVLSDRSKNFQQHIYWAMRHQFSLENTSYAATYANWAQVYDEFLGDKIWVPFSSVAGATYARNDAAEFPWSAPAGYTRGLVSGNVVNIAITPNQKQRDELYKSNINPVLFSPSQGMAIFGQKTMSRKPSSFDRINVRRLFLALERPTKKASVFYIFEPNNEFTQTRFKNTLTPIFEYAKQNGGLYDYEIICDGRVNTPEVIDNNELRATILIKPTRTCEFIVVEFASTRTDAVFSEIL